MDNNKKYYDIRRIRKINAKFLAKKYGGVCKFADFLDKMQAHLSHYLSPKNRKSIGFNMAREIEIKCNLPYGWMDNLHNGINYD
jgi:predicted amidophosphoribosyltransferase